MRRSIVSIEKGCLIMEKILFEGIVAGDVNAKKKEETLNLFEFNDIDYFLLENEIKLVRQLHKKRIQFYEENILGQTLTRNKVQAMLVLRDIECDAVKELHGMMEDILNKAIKQNKFHPGALLKSLIFFCLNNINHKNIL